MFQTTSSLKKNGSEEGYHTFSDGIFLSHSAETFRGEPFCVSENLGSRNILCVIWGITIFRRQFLVPQDQKTSWGTFLCFRKSLVWKNLLMRGGYHVFPSEFFSSQCRRTSWGTLCVSESFW